LPYAVARITSLIYVVINYPKNGFKFENAEYAYGFDRWDYYIKKAANVMTQIIYIIELL
jgi:hypothetical protein